MGNTWGIIIAAISFIGGILLLTGNGDFLMRGGANAAERKKMYDQTKVEKATGIALLVVGAATVIDLFTESLAAKIIYTVVIIAVFAALFYYMRTKCLKKK